MKIAGLYLLVLIAMIAIVPKKAFAQNYSAYVQYYQGLASNRASQAQSYVNLAIGANTVHAYGLAQSLLGQAQSSLTEAKQLSDAANIVFLQQDYGVISDTQFTFIQAQNSFMDTFSQIGSAMTQAGNTGGTPTNRPTHTY